MFIYISYDMSGVKIKRRLPLLSLENADFLQDQSLLPKPGSSAEMTRQVLKRGLSLREICGTAEVVPLPSPPCYWEFHGLDLHSTFHVMAWLVADDIQHEQVAKIFYKLPKTSENRGTFAPLLARACHLLKTRPVLCSFLSSTWGRADQQTSHDSNRVRDVLFCAGLLPGFRPAAVKNCTD
jgi:hypothetical protein